MESIKGYGAHSIGTEEQEIVAHVLENEYLTQGRYVDKFETKLGKLVRAKHTVAVSSGTAALHIALLALGVGPGDGVLVTAYSFAATANAVLYTGAKPIFVDIDIDTWNMSLDSLRKAYELFSVDDGIKIKAIIPVHFAGLPADMHGIRQFADAKGLSILVDACHALGGSLKSSGKEQSVNVGQNYYSDITAFSFHPVKHITTGEGGAICTNDPELASKVVALRSHGITGDPQKFRSTSEAFCPKTGSPNIWYKEMQSLGFNYRMTDIQAAIGFVQLDKAEQFQQRRLEIAARYDDLISGIDGVKTQIFDRTVYGHAYHLYAISIDFNTTDLSRHELMIALRDLGVPTQVHYIPINRTTYYTENSRLWAGCKTPNADTVYSEQLSIPMYQELTDTQASYVVECLARCLS